MSGSPPGNVQCTGWVTQEAFKTRSIDEAWQFILVDLLTWAEDAKIEEAEMRITNALDIDSIVVVVSREKIRGFSIQIGIMMGTRRPSKAPTHHQSNIPLALFSWNSWAMFCISASSFGHLILSSLANMTASRNKFRIWWMSSWKYQPSHGCHDSCPPWANECHKPWSVLDTGDQRQGEWSFDSW